MSAIGAWATAEFERSALREREQRCAVERVREDLREIVHLDLDEPEGHVLYMLVGRAERVESEFAATSALKIACIHLGVEPPHLIWFGEAEPCIVDGLAVRTFRHSAINGLAHTASGTVLLNRDLRPAKMARTAAHEVHHWKWAPIVAEAVDGDDMGARARALLDRAGRLLDGDPFADVARCAHEEAAAARTSDMRRQLKACQEGLQQLEAGAVAYGERIGRLFDLAPALSSRTPTLHRIEHTPAGPSAARRWHVEGAQPGDLLQPPKGLYVNVAPDERRVDWRPV